MAIRFNEHNEIIRETEYRAILVGLSDEKSEQSDWDMEELRGLAEAAGVTVVGLMTQAKKKPVPATFLGAGKVEELKEMCAALEADTVILNHELSGIQLRNMEDKLERRVIDRTILILDIFAARAISREGKLQVELAQLEYRLPRLTGFGRSLSRLGGGIGTRGPGEKQLETDRRHIRRRMTEIKAEIDDIRSSRATQRAQRSRSGTPLVALVGYTNSGKSALMNRLLELSQQKSEKTVTEVDQLFATLDTSHRQICLDTQETFILVDTVGFVSQLPHSLVKAFKATLEEAKYADLLLHVVDLTFASHDFQALVTEQVLAEIGAADKERIVVYNKVDLLPAEARPAYYPNAAKDYCYISARTGEGIAELIDLIRQALFGDRVSVSLKLPYDQGGLLARIRAGHPIRELEYMDDGVRVVAEMSGEDLKQYSLFVEGS